MSEKSSASSSGIGFSGMFFLVLFVLKVTGKIDWAWKWITAPLWIPACIVAILLLIVGVIWLVAD